MSVSNWHEICSTEIEKYQCRRMTWFSQVWRHKLMVQNHGSSSIQVTRTGVVLFFEKVVRYMYSGLVMGPTSNLEAFAFLSSCHPLPFLQAYIIVLYKS